MTFHKVDLPVPQEVREVVRTLERAGFSAWTVGGGVRDALAGERPQDWDVATAARPPQIQKLFRRTAAIGIEHGTVGVIGKSGRMYEVTTFRRDVETFGRKARVVFADTLEEDLARRDFTMNAVAWHPETRELRDPHCGVEDLRNRLLRTVGEPAERFREDRLRVLRGLRFAGRFGLEFDEATWQAAIDSAPELHLLSAERVREELWKVLGGQATPSRSLRLYGESGVLRELYPELEALREPRGERTSWEDTLGSVDAIPNDRLTVRLAALLRGIGSDVSGEASEHTSALRSAAMARDVMRRLKSSNADTDAVTHLIAQHADLPDADADDPAIRRWIRKVGADYVEDLLRLEEAVCSSSEGSRDCAEAVIALRTKVREVLRRNPALSVGDLAIGGNDLRAAGIPPGPRYATILTALLEKVTDDPALNERGRLLELLDSIQADIAAPEDEAGK